MPDNKNELMKVFPFIEPHVAKEAHIFELLSEIFKFQQHVLSQDGETLASIEELSNSRNIKIPFNNTRKKNITYLLEILLKNYPDKIKPIISFSFIIEKNSKKLIIEEKTEFTVNIDDDKFNLLKVEKDTGTIDSLLQLLGQFRLFNLTKLINKSKNKKTLSALIKNEIGNNIFVFNNFVIDNNNFESVDNYCFHRKNYDAVKKKLNIDELKNIIKRHSEPVKRRLKKFGILNSEFTDYREKKLDYLMNILLQDIASSLNKKDLAEVKNFNSLRTCLIDMNKVVDPLITISEDLRKYINENGICKQSELTSFFDILTPELLKDWVDKNINNFKIFPYTDGISETLYIDGNVYFNKISDLYNFIFVAKDNFSTLSHFEKNEYLSLMDMLCNVGKDILLSKDRTNTILKSEKNIESLRNILNEYHDSKRKNEEMKHLHKENHVIKEHKSLIRIIIDFIKSLFGRSKQSEEAAMAKQPDKTDSIKKRKTFSEETKDFYGKIKSSNRPLVPISDFIEITPENEIKIDTIISELRGNNLKIIIPIYNARESLYPKRSRKLLISDAEYLLVEPSIIQDPDTIREFTNSLAGYKIKDEILPSVAIILIEKYLLTLHRQHKARVLRR